jgi:hypothetical protein
MESKPIFVIYLPVGSLSQHEVELFVNNAMDSIKNEIHGWSVLIAPTRIAEEIRFEAFHVNNLKPVEKQQLDKIEKAMADFLSTKK